MKGPWLALLLAGLPLAAPGQVYRCDLDGSTRYQASPCPQGERLREDGAITTYPPPDLSAFPSLPGADPPSDRPSGRSTRDYLSTLDRRNAKARAHGRGHLVAGMSENQALTILGAPDSVGRVSHADGETCKTLRWDDPPFVDGRHRATICDGKVVRHNRQ
ncbi:hypothetical protein [Halomonas nitroreducens]|uniref:DUF4124 domain-containing protein n=1 Tax=Halomonas nitroreducens TaxID=447425 RepID=A0A431V2M6_9GAMM|nr:hypothetical protein [Halomonas nitroreducens]RTR02944.1 hypothetical protein EKG36_11680 [Halomonas nitroreducens]